MSGIAEAAPCPTLSPQERGEGEMRQPQRPAYWCHSFAPGAPNTRRSPIVPRFPVPNLLRLPLLASVSYDQASTSLLDGFANYLSWGIVGSSSSCSSHLASSRCR